jgi:hypothetical protein
LVFRVGTGVTIWLLGVARGVPGEARGGIFGQRKILTSAVRHTAAPDSRCQEKCVWENTTFGTNLAPICPQFGTLQGRGASRKGLGRTLECPGEAPRDVGAEVVGEGVGGVGDGVMEWSEMPLATDSGNTSGDGVGDNVGRPVGNDVGDGVGG